ncbi:class I SAM-dependent methyltransferase, partial [Amycolatopsis magusensis]
QIGTDAGVTALSLLSGMAQRGVLTSVDPETFHQETAREVLKEAQIATNRFRTIASNPLDVLPKLRDGAYDLVL